MIKCLPKDVQGKLRSGVAIPSLQQCVEELVLNSIDAEATCVGVRVDMEAFRVQVIDNGAGINAADMESVGKRYHTSKCSSVEDLDNLRWNGFRGEALASIASLATLVEISSRTRSSVKTQVKIFKAGKGMDVFEAATARPSAGTTVVVCNFLHNMPVRRKRMDAVLEGERIRHRVEAVSLMHPSVSFSLKNDCTGAMMVQLPKARNTYHRFVQIQGLGRAQKLGELSYTHGQFEVIGYIGREGHYNNSLQFLYANGRLLLKTQIHKLLNFLLRRLGSSNDSPGGQPATRSPRQRRSQELHGVYIIDIKCSYSEYDICLEPAKTLIEFKDWDGILLCIEEAVKAFLSKENLVAFLSQDELDSVAPETFGTDQQDLNTADDSRITRSASTDCNIGTKLSSGPVHRKRKDEENVDEECKEDAEQLGKQTLPGNETEKIKYEGSPNKEYTYNNDNAEEEEPEAEEGSEKVCLTSSVTQLELPKEKEMAPSSHITSLNSIVQQVQPDSKSTEKLLPVCHSAGGGECPVSKKKIRLSHPYIHEKLLAPRLPQTTHSVFQQPILAQRRDERSFASKHKISLEAGYGRHFTSIIPSKIPRVSTSQKLSLCQPPGSLDKFRRMCGRSDELKITSQEANNSELPLTDSSHGLLVCQEDFTGTEAGSKPALSLFTTLKPVSGQTRGKTSLAAKLCRLKRHRTDDSNTLPHLSSTTSQHSTQDSNNNQTQSDAPLDQEQDEATASGDWLHHYDTSVGKTVYVNKVTGLSRYEDLPTEETRARCTSDVTNMAVSVLSEMGVEHRCYPFQVELVLPFLPKSRTDRVISSGLGDRDVESSNSLTSLYSKWKNPVFVRPPMVGVDISSGQADVLAVKIHNILFPYRFSKAMIHSMKVIHQVDKKFLACVINTREEEAAALTEAEGNLLVLVDQHAAHERVRLETLIADSYEDDPDAPGERRLCSSTIVPPLEISVTEEEHRLLRSCQPHLRSLGLGVKFSEAGDPRLFVGKVPLCFMEKESNELRRGRTSVIKPVVEEYLREQIELLRSTGRVRGTLPLTVLKVLASLACHGAVKFNDSLSRDECRSLVASLSSCQLPFQCAHGRPSIAPLVDTLHLDKDEKEIQKPNLQKLRRMQKAWELYGNG